jgi:hypothetical protein
MGCTCAVAVGTDEIAFRDFLGDRFPTPANEEMSYVASLRFSWAVIEVHGFWREDATAVSARRPFLKFGDSEAQGSAPGDRPFLVILAPLEEVHVAGC